MLTLKHKKKNPKEMFLVALKKADENRNTRHLEQLTGLAKGDVPNGEANAHEGDQTHSMAQLQGEGKTGQLGKAGPLFALNHKGVEDEVSSSPVHTAQAIQQPLRKLLSLGLGQHSCTEPILNPAPSPSLRRFCYFLSWNSKKRQKNTSRPS